MGGFGKEKPWAKGALLTVSSAMTGIPLLCRSSIASSVRLWYSGAYQEGLECCPCHW